MKNELKWALGLSLVVVMWITSVLWVMFSGRDFDLWDIAAAFSAGFLAMAALGYFVLAFGGTNQ